MLKLMLITNQPKVARFAADHGVDRIFVDLELMGKKERQGHLDTLISYHRMEDVRSVRAAVPDAELLVRLNPFHDGIAAEIEDALAGGADLLMLPMFTNADEVARFCQLVDGRAGVIPLLETPAAMESLPDLVGLPGLVELYIGLNDLHLGLKQTFMFEPLARGLVDSMADITRTAGLPFGFGGIARMDEGLLPGKQILAEHLRLGSSSVILSRTFHRKSADFGNDDSYQEFADEVRKLREAEAEVAGWTPEAFAANRDVVAQTVLAIADERRLRLC